MTDDQITDEPPAGLVAAQRIAIQVAEAACAAAVAGQTERELHRIVDQMVLDAGAVGTWTPTTVGFGIGTLSCFPTDVPSERALWNLDLGMIDVHPVTVDGWWGDCTRSFQQGDNHAQRDAIATIDALSQIGVPSDKVKVILNGLEATETASTAFAPLLAYLADTKRGNVVPGHISDSEVYGRLAAAGQTIAEVVMQDFGQLELARKTAKSPEERLAVVRAIATLGMAESAQDELDGVWAGLAQA